MFPESAFLCFGIAAATAAFAAVFVRTGATIGTADALAASLFGPMYIPGSEANDHNQNHKNNDIFHGTAPQESYFALSAYSAARFLLVFLMRYTTMAAKHATAIRPGRKPEPRVPSVTRVPI